MFAIVTKSKSLSLPLGILFQLFDRVVLPVVLYVSEIYGHNDSCVKKLKIFQRYLYRKALKLRKSTSSVFMIYGETGSTPLHITIEKRMIGYWLQILMGSSSKLNYQIYTYILHLDMQNIILYLMDKKNKIQLTMVWIV